MGLSLEQYVDLILFDEDRPLTANEVFELVPKGYKSATPEVVGNHLERLIAKGRAVKAGEGYKTTGPLRKSRSDIR